LPAQTVLPGATGAAGATNKALDAPNFLFPILRRTNHAGSSKILTHIRTFWNRADDPSSTQITALGIRLPAFPIPAGKKRTEASKGEPQLNMMRENTDGLRNIAHCNMPFWMVPMTLNPVVLRVNCFFGEFVSIDCGW
jgi:hypothetical protein